MGSGYDNSRAFTKDLTDLKKKTSQLEIELKDFDIQIKVNGKESYII